MSSKFQPSSFSCFTLQTPIVLLILKVGIEATMNYPGIFMQPMYQYQNQQQQMMHPRFKQQLNGQQPYSVMPFEGRYRYPNKMMLNNNKKWENSYQSLKPAPAPKKSTILVESVHSSPINLLFRSISSSVNVMQDHKQSKGVTRYMNSKEEPVVLVMNITKPILQRVNEVILPQRQIQQMIYPIKESIETIIKDDGHHIMPQYESHSSFEQSNFA